MIVAIIMKELVLKNIFEIIFDEGKYKELNADIVSGDPLKFEDTKKYTDRVKASQAKTGSERRN